MSLSRLEAYSTSIHSPESTTAAIMDERSILSCISAITKRHIISFEDLREENIAYIFVYDIPEEKKELDIGTVRRFTIDVELKPYEGKNIYILRHFDTATIHAQNALLKILEDCPPYAAIILEVKNPKSILETILSRTIDLVSYEHSNILSTQGREIVEFYKSGKIQELTGILHNFKCSSEEAIAILSILAPDLSLENTVRAEKAIESLSATHENPRNILDVFFL